MITTNNFNEVIKALKYYAEQENGAVASSAIGLANEFLESQNNALNIIKNLVTGKEEIENRFYDSVRKTAMATQRMMDEHKKELLPYKKEIRRLQELCKKGKISYRKKKV